MAGRSNNSFILLWNNLFCWNFCTVFFLYKGGPYIFTGIHTIIEMLVKMAIFNIITGNLFLITKKDTTKIWHGLIGKKELFSYSKHRYTKYSVTEQYNLHANPRKLQFATLNHGIDIVTCNFCFQAAFSLWSAFSFACFKSTIITRI